MYTVEEIKQKKNEFLAEVLLGEDLIFFDSHKDKLNHKIIDAKGQFIALKIGKRKKIVLTNEEFEEEEHPDFPSVYVLINNDPTSQRIAISVDANAFSNSFVVANIIEENLSRYLNDYNIEIVVNPILNEYDFWQLIEKYEDRITQLKFNLVKPNLANISGTFKDEIRELTDSTNSMVTKVELNAPKGSTLENINEDNPRVKGLADYAIKGGSQLIHMKVKGIKRMIKTEKTISKISIDEVEVSGDKNQVMEVLESLTKEDE